jgi:hypothetical protein
MAGGIPMGDYEENATIASQSFDDSSKRFCP